MRLAQENGTLQCKPGSFLMKRIYGPLNVKFTTIVINNSDLKLHWYLVVIKVISIEIFSNQM